LWRYKIKITLLSCKSHKILLRIWPLQVGTCWTHTCTRTGSHTHKDRCHTLEKWAANHNLKAATPPAVTPQNLTMFIINKTLNLNSLFYVLLINTCIDASLLVLLEKQQSPQARSGREIGLKTSFGAICWFP